MERPTFQHDIWPDSGSNVTRVFQVINTDDACCENWNLPSPNFQCLSCFSQNHSRPVIPSRGQHFFSTMLLHLPSEILRHTLDILLYQTGIERLIQLRSVSRQYFLPPPVSIHLKF